MNSEAVFFFIKSDVVILGMARKKDKMNVKGVALFLVGTVMLISFGFYAFQIVYSPNILVERESRVVIIPRDADFKKVQDILYDGHIVNDLVSFSFLAKLMSYNDNIKPGRYLLEPNMTNIQAIRKLRAGEQTPVNITFNNVRTIDQLAPKITERLSISEDEFNAALVKFLDSNEDGFTSETIVSMFIPNTYEVYYSVSADELVERMRDEYFRFWNEARRKKAEKLGFSTFEISTLASIVQAETSKGEEKPTVAGLYLNRLQKGMALQADPTLVFASGDFELKRILNVHKEIESPYNTYKYKGLPPGPINMPTIQSIDAVLNYKEHDYLYMCAKEDFSGYHAFAVTYEEHLRNARRYQRQLTIEQRKARINPR